MAKHITYKLDPNTWAIWDVTTEGKIRLTPEKFPHARQREYLESTYLHTLFGGERGSGKTYVSMIDVLFAAHFNPGCEQIFFRRTLNELKETVVREFLKLPEDLRGRYTDSLTSPKLILPNGSIIHFASVNNYEAATKYQGRQFFRIIFDEWALIPYEWWSYITGSLRSTDLFDATGQAVRVQIKGLSNPGGPGSDVLRRMFGADCEKHKPKNLDIEYDPNDYFFIKSKLDDNPVYAAGTRAGDAYRKVLKSKPAAIRAAWLEGKWTGFEGMYFDCFDADVTKVPHDIILQLMAQQYWMPIFLGIDVGQVHHSYCCWSTMLSLPLADGTHRPFVVTFDEWMDNGLSERGIAGAILDKMRGNDEVKSRIKKIYLSPETFGEASRTRARVIGDVFVSDKPPVCRPTQAKTGKYTRENGLRLMYTLLSERHKLLYPITDHIDPATGFQSGLACDWLVSDRCTELLSALPWAASDPAHPGDIKKDGDSELLDVLDGARYAIYSNSLALSDKPAADQQHDRLRLMAQTNAPETFTMKMYSDFINELRNREKPQTTEVGRWTAERHKWRGQR